MRKFLNNEPLGKKTRWVFHPLIQDWDKTIANRSRSWNNSVYFIWTDVTATDQTTKRVLVRINSPVRGGRK